MPIPTRLAPLPPEGFGLAEARQLLMRTGFGPSPADIYRAVADGLEMTVATLVGYTGVTSPAPPAPAGNGWPPRP